MQLAELLKRVKRSKPIDMEITNHIREGNSLILRASVTTDVPYSQIEDIRKEWETESGWDIAIDIFYYSAELEKEIIKTILNTVPNIHEVKRIEKEEDRITIYTTNVQRIFGKKNRNFTRLKALLPDNFIQIKAIDKGCSSENLKSIEKKIAKTANDPYIVEQVTNMIPQEFYLRKINLQQDTKTIHITYGTAKLEEKTVSQLKEKISRETGWEVELKRKLDQDNLRYQIEREIPETLPKCKVSFYKEECYFVIRCNGDMSHIPLLEELTKRLSEKYPVEVKYKLVWHDQKLRELIMDFIPEEWGLQKVSFNQEEQTAVIACGDCPEGEERKEVLEAIEERIEFKIYLEQDRYAKIDDEELLKEVCELIPESCGFSYMAKHVTSPQYFIFVRRGMHQIPLKKIKKILGTKQVFAKVTKEEKMVSPHVRKALSHISRECTITPINREAEKCARLTGFGACEEVGRSCFYLEMSGLKILFDCGASFGEKPYPEIPKKVIRDLDFVFLSHAHTDHSALIPWLYKQKCTAQLIATSPTFSISRLMMKDYIKVQKKYRGEEPAYESEDIATAFSYGRVVQFDQRYLLGNNIFFTFLNAGHILGATAILIEDGKKRLLYTGDLSLTETRILQPATMPHRGMDYVVIETTYGGKKHTQRQDSEKYFLERVEKVLEDGGTVIIPCFAVGRSQEILMLLSEHPKMGYNKKFPVYVDGLITKINDIHRSYLSSSEKVYLNSSLKSGAKNIFTSGRTFFNNIRKREAMVKDQDPKVILTTSGMCEGLSRFYLSGFIEDPKNLLMLVGYQAEGSTGYDLVNGSKTFEIDGKTYDIKIQIDQSNFSGHADEEQLLAYLSEQNLEYLITVHGESTAMDSFTHHAQERQVSDKIVKAQINRVIELY